jgi:hypothetical protein
MLNFFGPDSNWFGWIICIGLLYFGSARLSESLLVLCSSKQNNIVTLQTCRYSIYGICFFVFILGVPASLNGCRHTLYMYSILYLLNFGSARLSECLLVLCSSE